MLQFAGNLNLGVVVVMQGVLIGVNEWPPALLSFSVIVVLLVFGILWVMREYCNSTVYSVSRSQQELSISVRPFSLLHSTKKISTKSVNEIICKRMVEFDSRGMWDSVCICFRYQV